jgi:hypothetical protein
VDLEARRRAADQNVAEALAMTVDHDADPRGGRVRFGLVEAIATGVGAAFFNPVLAFPSPRAAFGPASRAATRRRGR